MFETILMFVLQACQVSSVHESLSSWMSVMFSSPAPVTVSRKSLAREAHTHTKLRFTFRFSGDLSLLSYSILFLLTRVFLQS
jgi:hypothetical protein